MKKLDEILDNASVTPPANGKTSSSPEQEDSVEPAFEIVCHAPNDSAQPCPICAGKGVIYHDLPLSDPQYGKFQRCPNNPVKADRGLHERLRRFGNLDAYSGMTFDSFRLDLYMRGYSNSEVTSLRKAKEAAQTFAESTDGWLLLEGAFGSGKTHLAAAIANWLLEAHGKGGHLPHCARFAGFSAPQLQPAQRRQL